MFFSGNIELVRTLIKSSNVSINQLNADFQSPLGLAVLYNHDDVGRFLLDQEKIRVQSTDLKIAMQMNNYDMVRLLIEKDRNCLRVRSSTHGDMIIHTFMRLNLNNSLCLETLLSFISDNELLTYLSEGSLVFGDNLLHIAGRGAKSLPRSISIVRRGENSKACVALCLPSIIVRETRIAFER